MDNSSWACVHSRAIVVTVLGAAILMLPYAIHGQKPPVEARLQEGLPEELQEVAFEQMLDRPLPRETTFLDAAGRTVELGRYLGKRPAILAFVYHGCPMLCSLVLDGLVRGLRVLSLDVGSDFDVIVVSFDARDTPEMAAAKKRHVVQRYGREGSSNGWHFLTGTDASIGRLTRAVGFRYRYDREKDQFAHASGIVVATLHGRISRYFYGIEYAPRDLRLGIVEASQGRIGSPVDQLLLYCFHYDPETGKYGFVVMSLLRIGAVATVLGLAVFILVLARGRSRRERASLTRVS